MNIFRGIQGLSCLHRQPNPDTPSVTASGQWTTTEPGRLLPRPREVERNALLQAARSGRLAIRHIASAEEASNFDGTPRSFTLALQGMPSEKPADQHKWRIGIVDPKCLYIYKKDADTRRPEHGTAADKLDVKLLSDLQSLDEKCKEMKHRAWWEVYPWQSTSGHLRADGIFSLPKLKPGKYGASLTVSVNPYGPLPHPKIVVTHYRNADIKCFFVERSNYKNISDILHQKRECEQALGIEPLPLVVFCCLTGSVEVCYDDELDSRHLAMIENSLHSFVSSCKIRKIMNLLPMPLQAKALSSGFTIPPNDQHKWQQAIELVSNPGHYSYPELLALKESGLPIHRCFLYEGTVTSLLDMFLMSETDRYNNLPGQQEIPAQEDADRLLRLLLHSGAILAERGWSFIRTMGDCEQLSMPLAIFNYLVAAFAPFKALTLQNLWNIPLTSCPGGVVEFDRICKKCPDRELQNGLKEELSPKRLLQKPTLDTIQSHLLALFHYGAVLDEDVLETVKSDLGTYYRDDTTIIENLSVAGFIDWLEKLRQEHQSHPFYLDWQAHVKEAREEIKKKKQSLELPDYPHASVAPALQFMVDAFSEPPVLPDNVGDNEDTILTVLKHYYRRPGPERVIAASLNPFLPDMWKQYHSCSDVLRARNNGLWYMELLENCRVYSFHPQERSLLALAIMYHDAATVDVDKPAAITKSAEYFKRDLAEHFPEQLLNNMALAMVSMANEVNGKADQNLSESVRWYLRVLRFAVRMDRIRLKADFPGLAVTQHKNPAYLDLPTQLVSHFSSDPDHKTEFQRHLEAAMHGAADLVQVTNDSTDKRDNPYTQVFALAPDVEIITRQFDRTAEPLQRMDQFINDNVRREIVQVAGIITCSDPDHQACKADRSKGITYGIHNSWYDLQQVAVPAGMTPLEKMQYRHDPSLLSPATQQALAEEVQRLKSKGIQMNPGTLTQETLATREARKVLKERGIAVVSEKRTVYTDNGKLRKWPMLVPKKIA